MVASVNRDAKRHEIPAINGTESAVLIIVPVPPRTGPAPGEITERRIGAIIRIPSGYSTKSIPLLDTATRKSCVVTCGMGQ